MIALNGLVIKNLTKKNVCVHRLLNFTASKATTIATTTTTMILPSNNNCNNPGQSIGFSFSPGGLLLPYHMGVADCLIKEKYIDPSETLIAGSSAGSIATMAIGCGLDPIRGLEGTISISDRCLNAGKPARGNLLPLLEEQMEALVGFEEFEFLQSRRKERNSHNNDDKTGTGMALAYREVFPQRKSYFQTKFENREELFRSVRYSCMFPFFTTNFPCLLDMEPVTTPTNTNNIGDRLPLPRLLMDGYFSVPRPQFGCPILQDEFPDSGVKRTVAITCIPQEIFGMKEVFGSKLSSKQNNNNNLISINDSCEETNPLSTVDIFRIATKPTSRKELTDLFERGYRDAELWCRREEDNRDQQQQQQQC
jgi:hypothetical protein